MCDTVTGDPTQGQEESERDEDQDRGHCQRCAEIAFHCLIDCQRHRLRAAGKIAREQNRRAKLAQRTRPAQGEYSNSVESHFVTAGD